MKRNLKCLVLFCFIISLISCGGQFSKMTTVDKAGTTARELTSSYLTLYQIADNITNNGSVAQKEFMVSQVNPKLNKIKLSLISIDKGVALWKDGGVDVMNVMQQISDVKSIIDDVTKLINLVTVKS